MIPSQLIPTANHLWQATLFAGVAGLLTLFLRKNRAHVRYWLWLMASVKFLLPFSILVAVGGLLGRHTTAGVAPTGLVPAADFSSFVEQIGQPFTTTLPQLAMPVQRPYTSVVVGVLGIVWATGFVTLVCLWTLRWRRMRALVRKASPLDLPGGLQAGLPVKSSPAFGEPGVFGIFRPVLLLPDRILDCLTAREMEAIVAHELCHVRRRDNLATVVHMAVEVVFWFHPLVWWLGARLMEERERACDEEVLRSGGEPRIYAEGILKICELYLASPLACVAGVTGGDLKGRIEAIISNRVVCRLNYAKKAVLAVAAIAAVAVPVLTGILHPPQSRAQAKADGLTFEVASVKPGNLDSQTRGGFFTAGGGMRITNMPLKWIIMLAFDMQAFQVSGGPAWIESQGFDIAAKAATKVTDDARQPTAEERRQARLRLQALLAERFQLVVRRETKELPVYHLVVAKNGPRLKESTSERGISQGAGEMTGIGATTEVLATVLARNVGHPVLDKTNLTARYDFTLKFTPEMVAGGFETPGAGAPDRKAEGGGASDVLGPSIFTALQEQLGLKLESQKGPVETIVIERVEKPTAN